MNRSFHELRITQLTNRSALASLGLAERTFGKDSPQFRTVRDFMKEKRAGYVHVASTAEAERVKVESGLKSPYSGIDVIYYTVLRKVKFTMMEHAHGLGDGAAIPFLTFGESFEENGKLVLPHSMRIHHGLVDGQHVGRYYERLEEILNSF